MLEAFASLKPLLKTRRSRTDTLVFYLHYRVTFVLLMSCCILISTNQFVGTKIKCMSRPSRAINVELIENYCWAASTYSVSSSYLKEAGVEIPHPGVEPSSEKSNYEYRNFYQYLHIVLLIQAVLFYVPHLIWKNVNSSFVEDLSNIIDTFRQERYRKEEEEGVEKKEEEGSLKEFFKERRGRNRPFAIKYLLCELLATCNVLLQSYMLDIFLHGKFVGLGLLVESYYRSNVLSDPLQLFPLVTICNFKRYGPSGYMETFDCLCVLPVNALNAKIYLFLWIWFLLLFILSWLSVLYFVFCFTIPFCRVFFFNIAAYLSISTPPKEIRTWLVSSNSNFGDWFVLKCLQKNMGDLEFQKLLVRSLEPQGKETLSDKSKV